MNLPIYMNKMDKAPYDRLSKLLGAEFDREYAKLMVKDHEKDVAEFEKESQDGKDESIKNLLRRRCDSAGTFAVGAADGAECDERGKIRRCRLVAFV